MLKIELTLAHNRDGERGYMNKYVHSPLLINAKKRVFKIEKRGDTL